MSIADIVSYPTEDGIGCEFPTIHYVKIDDPAAHMDVFRKPDGSYNIEPCPYGETNFQALLRPYFKEGMIFWQVIDPIHNWIEEAGYEYCLDRRWVNKNGKNDFGWMVGFRKKSEAAHFKLAWHL